MSNVVASSQADWTEAAQSCTVFVACVLEEGAAHYRELPWRFIDDPYAVLVSEVMLQQTQVVRVERYWRRFLEAFPTLDALAAASTSDVLNLWQGLGYNRRALALKRAADWCAASHAGTLPATYEELLELPGIGPATASGVMAFAHNKDALYLETNVRAVLLHELFPMRDQVSDRMLEPYLREATACALERVDARTWYYALLDYGAHLKATTVNPSRRSSHYARQSAFEGSRRQKRSFVLRCVLASEGPVERDAVYAELNQAETRAGRPEVDAREFTAIVDDLVEEGFFSQSDSGVLIP